MTFALRSGLSMHPDKMRVHPSLLSHSSYHFPPLVTYLPPLIRDRTTFRACDWVRQRSGGLHSSETTGSEWSRRRASDYRFSLFNLCLVRTPGNDNRKERKEHKGRA